MNLRKSSPSSLFSWTASNTKAKDVRLLEREREKITEEKSIELNSPCVSYLEVLSNEGFLSDNFTAFYFGIPGGKRIIISSVDVSKCAIILQSAISIYSILPS